MAGDDILHGGTGHDVVLGGNGDDEIWGDSGSRAATPTTRSTAVPDASEPVTITCGAGFDVVELDKHDRTTGDCEKIVRH